MEVRGFTVKMIKLLKCWFLAWATLGEGIIAVCTFTYLWPSLNQILWEKMFLRKRKLKRWNDDTL